MKDCIYCYDSYNKRPCSDVGAYAGWVKSTIVTDILVFKNRIQTAAVKRLIFSQIRDTMLRGTVLKTRFQLWLRDFFAFRGF
jgi:hypothetical protein